MIKPYDKLRVTFWNDRDNPIDISLGTIAIDIEEGVDYWEGDWQQPDYGRFTLVTKNTQLDPLINPDVKFNKRITFETAETYETGGVIYPYTAPVFIGYITDINVEYEPNGDSTITIQGTDIIGIFKRVLIDQTILDWLADNDYGPEPMTFNEFLEGIQQYFYTELNIWFNKYFEYGEDTGGSLGVPFFEYRPSEYIPKIGDSILDIFYKHAQTNLDTISTRTTTSFPDPDMYIRAFLKYSPEYCKLLPDPLVTYGAYRDFDSVNEPYHGYTKIKVTQNFDKITNQIYINNTSSAWNPSTSEAEYTDIRFDPFVKPESVQSNGYSQVSLDLLMPADKANVTEFTRYTRDIFEETAILKFDVEEIEFNNLQRDLSGYYCGEVVRVTHRVSPTILIDKIYKIAGIKHSINEYSWYTTYIFKPSDTQRAYDHQQENNYGAATVQMNATSGDTNFNFTATLTNFPSAMIDTVKWFVGSPYDYVNNPGLVYELSQSGQSFKNNTPRTGLSLTANFDDGGILAEDGPGYNCFVAVITDIDGYNFFVKSPDIAVTGAQAHADFQYFRDSYDGYDFYSTSGPDTDTWAWNFGDGTTSTLADPPIKYYNNPGTYNVSLTVSNGVTTDTHIVPITVTSTLIPVKYLKYEFKGTRTKTGGVWNKEFIRYFSLIQANLGDGSSFSYNAPTTIVATKGTARVYPSNNVLPSPNKFITDSTWSGPLTTTDIKLDPLVTNGGNTEEYDISFIVDLSKKIATSGTDGVVLTTLNNMNWDGPSQERFKLTDSLFVPKNWVTNVHYEPINVYVSADGTNYYKIGDQNIYRTTYPPTGYTLAVTLDNKVLVPPRFPT